MKASGNERTGMKIAILSMQRVVNFGSVLQAWSLREMVREVTGVEAEFLDIVDTPALSSMHQCSELQSNSSSIRYSCGILQRGKRWCITQLSKWNKRLIRGFMRKELRLETGGKEAHYDYVIVGSDEVFNHAAGIRLQLHGEVPQAGSVVAYAASCGSAKLEDIYPEDLPRVRQAMSRFSGLSVRDAGTANYAEPLYNGPLVRHMDPVLMGNLHARKPRSVWLKNYLLVYAYGHRIHTPEEINAIRNFAKEKKLKIVAIGGSQAWCDLYIPATPMRVLDWFANADYVVTDTFHGVVFSVINRRKFAAIIRPSNQNKMSCLLADLGLSRRLVTDMSQLPVTIERDIDYLVVEAILNCERQRAREYLKEQLNHAQRAHRTGS